MLTRNKILRYAVFIGLLMSMTNNVLHEGSSKAQAVAPSFLSTPVLTADLNQEYDYEIIPSNYSATIMIWWTDSSWASFYLTSWHLIGFPNETDIGLAHISLRMNLSSEYTWQNFTVVVQELDRTPEFVNLTLAFTFGFGLMAAGFKRNEFFILAGPVWIICGLTIFITYGVVFLLVSVGLGLVLMFKGVSPYL